MTVEEFLDQGRKLYKALEAVSPYPVHSYAADVRAMLPKALKALEVSCEALRSIDGPGRSLQHGIDTANAALADIQAILEEEA